MEAMPKKPTKWEVYRLKDRPLRLWGLSRRPMRQQR